MSPRTRMEFEYIQNLMKDPLADSNTIQRLKTQLELADVSNFTREDWQLYNQVFN